MFSSVRSRLWLSYVFLTGIILALFTFAVLIAIRQSPVFYRQATLNLRLANIELAERINQIDYASSRDLDALLLNASERLQMRIFLIANDGSVLFDSDQGVIPPRFSNRIQNNFDFFEDSTRVRIFRDPDGTVWFFNGQKVGDNFVLVTATPRPNVPIIRLVREEFGRPILRAGVAAVFLAFLLSFLISNWISKPLQKMAESANSLVHGNYKPIPAVGPKEVRQLAYDLNWMAKQVQANQLSQREFLSDVSHELKTPLTSIQGFSQAILDRAISEPEKVQNAAQIIYDEAGRMNRLVLDLISLAKLESGTADLVFNKIDLTSLINSVVEKMQLVAAHAEVNIHTNFEDLPDFFGDVDRLSQVFTNLIDNGIKYSPKNGNLSISGYVQKTSIFIEFSDNGGGIPEEHHGKIFDRFYQVDKSRKGGEDRGVGLGLAIAREIVQAHNGKIWVENNPSGGSIFKVALPVNPLGVRKDI